jgi:hypothetical protein
MNLFTLKALRIGRLHMTVVSGASVLPNNISALV